MTTTEVYARVGEDRLRSAVAVGCDAPQLSLSMIRQFALVLTYHDSMLQTGLCPATPTRLPAEAAVV
jgi:hypothetical protein